MKSFFTLIVALAVIAAIGALLYGGYLGLIYLWQVYAGLDEVIRIVLLSAMAAVLLSAFVIAGAIKSAGQAAVRNQMGEAKLGLYKSLVEAYATYFTASDQSSPATIFAKLEALQAELQILSSSSVLESHGRLAAALRDRQPRERIEDLFRKLVKNIRRDMGHGAQYDESRLKFLITTSGPGDQGRVSPGVTP
ncbi:MAG: hypothetical protein OES26_27230 [Gammaproteobacteria bacterium]|nr:hypothetical protein [Gammaproteobacteria bacterium]